MLPARPSIAKAIQTLAIDHAAASEVDTHADAAAPAGSPAAAAGASASASSAASGASPAAASPASTTHTALSEAAGSDSRGSAPPSPLLDDLFGLVSGYLPSSEQHALRDIGHGTAVVDRHVGTLSLDASAAAKLFKSSAGFPTLQRVHLRGYNAEDFERFAHALAATRHAPFELILPPLHTGTYPPRVLDLVSAMNLSGLVLREARLEHEDVDRLMQVQFPITITLAPLQQDVSPAIRLPRLTSLSMNFSTLSEENALQLGAHLRLTEFVTLDIHGEHLQAILANPNLTSLALDSIEGENDDVITALAQHPAITSLELQQIQSPDRLALLFANPVITSLKMAANHVPAVAMEGIANMPSLTAFTLLSPSQGSVNEAQLAALCAKPLEHLHFEMVLMTPEALVRAASAHASNLSFNSVSTINPAGGFDSGEFSQDAVNAAVANPNVVSLSITGQIAAGGCARLAAAPGIQKLSIFTWLTAETVVDVQQAWIDAGKSLADLDVNIT